MYALKSALCPNLRIAPRRTVAEPKIYGDLTDNDLIVACQKHEQAAFTALYKRYLRHVSVTIYRLSPDWQSSHDDMVQEVFVRVWRSLGNLKNPLAFKTWLNRLVANMFYDELRRRPRNSTVSLDQPINHEDGEDCFSRDIADTKHQPDDEFARKEILEQINGAITLLPKQFADALVLREFDGLSYEEIARLTKSQVGTVKSRIARARVKMQCRLQLLHA